MEVMSSPSTCYDSLKRCWRRRKYQRLNGGDKRRLKIARLGGETASRRGLWKIRTVPKLQLKIVSPFKLLAKFHDAYVHAMILFVNGMGKANDGSLFGGKKVAKDKHIAVASGGEEVDSRLVLEIYKRLAASRELRDL